MSEVDFGGPNVDSECCGGSAIRQVIMYTLANMYIRTCVGNISATYVLVNFSPVNPGKTP